MLVPNCFRRRSRADLLASDRMAGFHEAGPVSGWRLLLLDKPKLLRALYTIKSEHNNSKSIICVTKASDGSFCFVSKEWISSDDTGESYFEMFEGKAQEEFEARLSMETDACIRRKKLKMNQTVCEKSHEIVNVSFALLCPVFHSSHLV